MVSHNSARLLTSLLRRQRLRPDPRADQLPAQRGRDRLHRRALGASVLLVDPELDDDLAGVTAPHRFVIGDRGRRGPLRLDRRARDRGTPDEDATATINYTSGTTARPKGVQLTHRNLWLNATTFGWQTGVSRPRRLPAHAADVPLQRLGHAVRRHRHGRHPGRAPQGRRRRDPAPHRGPRRHPALRRARRRGRRSSTPRPTWDGPIPGAGRTRMVVAGAPPPTRTIERVETELGWEFIQIYGLTETAPLLTMNRGAGRVRRPARPPSGPSGWAGPARRRSASRCGSTTRARCWPGATT